MKSAELEVLANLTYHPTFLSLNYNPGNNWRVVVEYALFRSDLVHKNCCLRLDDGLGTRIIAVEHSNARRTEKKNDAKADRYTDTRYAQTPGAAPG